jgi:assimilatory nitrate reductase catalytic subunit
MFIGVKDGRAVSVRGNPDHPANRGWLCPKGLSEHQILDAPNRARTPLLRDGAELKPVTWDIALGTMAARFRGVQARYGAQAVGVISTGQLVTEEFYTLGKLVQLGLGTSNYCGNTTLCMSTAVSGYKRSFGSDGPPGCYDDFECADFIMLVGANIAENHPILCRRLAANPATTLVVVDPRVTKTAMMADVHLPIRPRSDLALINGLIRLVIDHDLLDHAYIEAHTSGFETLRESVQAYTPEYVSTITGLAPEVIVQTALGYGRAKAALIAWTMGVNHSTKGTETVNAINNLSLITGNIGRPGAAPLSITGQCNAMGTREVGCTSSLPGYRSFESDADRQAIADLWHVDVGRIPTTRGLPYPDIIQAITAGKIKALWIIGTNPIVSFPDLEVLQRALASLDCLVVQDGFHPTPTSELAHIVLPAGIWGEKEGTYTNTERRVSKANRAVEPPGDARADFDIFLALATVLGVRDALFAGWQSAGDAFADWCRVSAGQLCDYSGMTYDLIEQHGGLQWPCPAGDSNPASVRRLYEDGVFETEDGKARLIPTSWEPFPEQPSERFPMVLNTGRTVEHWHTRTKTGQVAILERMAPSAWCEMNPSDADRLSLGPDDRVDVVSARGRVRSIELRLTETVAPGQVFVPFHYAEANANQLTQPAFDPISREPNYKQTAVRVERAAAATAGAGSRRAVPPSADKTAGARRAVPTPVKTDLNPGRHA